MAQANRSMVNMLLLGIAVVALVVLVYFLAVQSQTDDQSQEVGITNAVPTIDSIYASTNAGHGWDSGLSNFTLTENSDTTVYIYGTFTDNNGCQNADTGGNWMGKFYRSGVASANNCFADNNDCYVVGAFTITDCSGAGDMTGKFEASTVIAYYADATSGSGVYSADTWVAYAIAGDEDSGQSSPNWATPEIDGLTAFDVTASVDYGSVALGATSSEKTITFTSTGNTGVDAQQGGASNIGMPCDGEGIVPWENVEMSPTTSFSYGDGTDFADNDAGDGAASLTAGLNLEMDARTIDATPKTKPAYLLLQMPSSGVKGSCAGTITFSAVPQSTY